MAVTVDGVMGEPENTGTASPRYPLQWEAPVQSYAEYEAFGELEMESASFEGCSEVYTVRPESGAGGWIAETWDWIYSLEFESGPYTTIDLAKAACERQAATMSCYYCGTRLLTLLEDEAARDEKSGR